MHNLKAQDCTHKEVELPQLSKVHSAFQTLDCVPNIRMGLTKQAFTKGGVGVIVAQFLYDSRIQKTPQIFTKDLIQSVQIFSDP